MLLNMEQLIRLPNPANPPFCGAWHHKRGDLGLIKLNSDPIN